MPFGMAAIEVGFTLAFFISFLGWLWHITLNDCSVGTWGAVAGLSVSVVAGAVLVKG
jgi:hypothetical protein